MIDLLNRLSSAGVFDTPTISKQSSNKSFMKPYIDMIILSNCSKLNVIPI